MKVQNKWQKIMMWITTTLLALGLAACGGGGGGSAPADDAGAGAGGGTGGGPLVSFTCTKSVDSPQPDLPSFMFGSSE